MQHTTETTKQYQCRHIFTDGRRCASPCLRQEEFCYYHHTSRKPIASPKQRRSRRTTFDLPLPEDRSAIQASIGHVLQRIASNEIDPRRAGLLLYGLQIASLNLPKYEYKTKPLTRPAAEPQTVEEIIIDPTLGVLAPRTEVSEITTRKSPVAQLIERMLQNEKEPSPTPEPATIPTLQATEEHRTSAVHLHTITKSKGGVIPTEPRAQSRGKWRDPRSLFFAVVCSIPNNELPPNSKDLISTGGGALAAPVEKSASLPPLSQPHPAFALTRSNAGLRHSWFVATR
jgi:hypothetical protein